MASLLETLNRLGNEYSEEHGVDFAIYFGEMRSPHDKFVIRTCYERRRRSSLMLMLATRGGDASVAYRVGRALQDCYRPKSADGETGKPQFTVFIPTLCKSAGTILAIAGSKLIMSELAELGPIDVQLRNPLEVGERTSSLTPIQAIESLSIHSKALFRQHFRQLRFNTSLTFSTKLAAETATALTVGLLKPMYEQVDPIRLAEVERSLKISSDYAQRLSHPLSASNLQDEAIEKLVGSYPSHGFVIDRKEATELFKDVELPSEQLLAIADAVELFMRWMLEESTGQSYFAFLGDEPQEKPDEDHAGTHPNGEGKADEQTPGDSLSREGSSPSSTTGKKKTRSRGANKKKRGGTGDVQESN